MRNLSLCWSVVLIGFLASGLRADWPQFRGPMGMGVSREKDLPTTWSATQNIVWKVPLPGPGASTPIIHGQRIYLTSFSGYVPGQEAGIDKLKRHLLCLNRADGKLVWDRSIDAPLPEQVKIRENHGYATNSPAADEKGVCVFYGRGGVLAYDHQGKEIWKADVGSKLNGWGSAASPLLMGELVIINASVESDSLIALDRNTGKEVWRAGGIKESWNTPIPVDVDGVEGGAKELIVAIMGKVLGFDPATGKQLWSCATDIGWYMVPSLVEDKGVVYCIGGRGGGNGALAVRTGGRGDVTKTHRLWKVVGKGSNVTSPVFHEGHLYWMHENDGKAFCAEAKTGSILYEESIGRAGQVYGSAVLGDGKIYYLTRGGKTLVVAAKSAFELLATNELGERGTFNSSPAIAGGRIYIRSDKFLYCIGK